MPPSTKEFLLLQAAWDAKLKDSGFTDIEDRRSCALKTWHSSDFNRKFLDDPERSAEQYYASAGRFLHDHVFPSALERRIWELHCEGLSIRETVVALESKVLRWKVNQILTKLKTEMVAKWRE